MANEHYRDIVLHLNTLQELFVVPAPDPLSERIPFVTGIETIQTAMRSRPGRQPTRATIFLPRESIEPNTTERAHMAIGRFCRFKIQQNKNLMHTLTIQALKALLAGVVVLILGLLLTDLLQNTPLASSFLKTLFGDGFDIAFWVILWRPVDFFLFDLGTYRKDTRVYTQLMQMEIDIAPEP